MVPMSASQTYTIKHEDLSRICSALDEARETIARLAIGEMFHARRSEDDAMRALERIEEMHEVRSTLLRLHVELEPETDGFVGEELAQ
jgi:hypothetical protein